MLTARRENSYILEALEGRILLSADTASGVEEFDGDAVAEAVELLPAVVIARDDEASTIYDNSRTRPRLVARGEGVGRIVVSDVELWSQIKEVQHG